MVLNWQKEDKAFSLIDLGPDQISVMVFILQYLLPRNAQWTLDQT